MIIKGSSGRKMARPSEHENETEANFFD